MPEEGEVELIHLAQKHLHFLLPLTLSEANFASKCTVLVKPCRPLQEASHLAFHALNIA